MTRQTKTRLTAGDSGNGSFSLILAVIATVLLIGSVGCSSRPAAIKPPEINAARASAKAMELFDGNQDGYLDGNELDQSPGLKVAVKQVDKDNDGKLSADEIAARIQEWLDAEIGTLPAASLVKLNGKPLAQAEVTFDPEPFFEGAVPVATGVTDFMGKTGMGCEPYPFGAQVGFYRVRISKVDGGKETIPARYNTDTTLGAEVSPNAAGIHQGGYVFTLKR